MVFPDHPLTTRSDPGHPIDTWRMDPEMGPPPHLARRIVPSTSSEFGDSQIGEKPQPLPFGRYFSDGLLIFFMGVGLEAFCRFYGPYERGFFCDDESIRYPHKPNSITVLSLLSYCLLTNFVLVTFVESFRLYKSNTSAEYYSELEKGRTPVGRLLVRLAIIFGYALSTLLVVMTITTATKYPVGRLRPHFMDVCRPNIGYDSCNTSTYITNYTCTTDRSSDILEARLSFFSGHSSLSLSAATFAIWYLQDRLTGQTKSRVVVPILQTLILCLALFIAYTRIFDNWHHWSDVLIGCLVGFGVTSILCKYMVGFIPRIQSKEHSQLLHCTDDQHRRLCTLCRFRPAADIPYLPNRVPNADESIA